MPNHLPGHAAIEPSRRRSIRAAAAVGIALCAMLGPGLPSAIAQPRIVSPEPGETVHSNNGHVPVIVTGVAPDLRMRPLLDGEPAAPPTDAPALELRGVPRGTHEVRIELIDARGDTVGQLGPVTFHVWQASRRFPNRGGGAMPGPPPARPSD